MQKLGLSLIALAAAGLISPAMADESDIASVIISVPSYISIEHIGGSVTLELAGPLATSTASRTLRVYNNVDAIVSAKLAQAGGPALPTFVQLSIDAPSGGTGTWTGLNLGDIHSLLSLGPSSTQQDFQIDYTASISGPLLPPPAGYDLLVTYTIVED